MFDSPASAPPRRRLLTGLARLARHGEIELTQEVVAAPPPRDDGLLHLRDKASWDVDLIVDDRFLARIDVHIGTEIDPLVYRGCDLYFKRYIDRRQSPGRDFPKLRPYTLCHDVRDGGFDGYEAHRIVSQAMPLAERTRQLARFVAVSLRTTLGLGSRLVVEDIQSLPAPDRDPTTLFMTRL